MARRDEEAQRRFANAYQGLPLSSRHIQVEQDRAPSVLPHHAKLARQAIEVAICRDLAAHDAELGLRAVERDLVGLRINLEQRLAARKNLLVLADLYLAH